MNRSSEEVEADVEASRSELDRNVAALKEKLTPGQLLDEAREMMGAGGRQVASKFVEQAKQNPMPLAVMGVGLAWLMASNRSGSAPAEPRRFSAYDIDTEPSGGAVSETAEGLKAKAAQVKAKTAETVATARDKLAGGASSVKEGARQAVQNLGSVADEAGAVGQKAQQGFMDALEREPLLIGAIGLIVGVAIGSALPPTEAEDRTVGPLRDRLVDKGKDLAQTGLEQASSAAQAAYSNVKSELQAEGGEGDLAEKVSSAVKAGVQGAEEELKRPH
jgi:hypothetical protein